MSELQEMVQTIKHQKIQSDKAAIEAENERQEKIEYLASLGLIHITEKVGYFGNLHSFYRPVKRKFWFINYIGRDYYARQHMFFDSAFYTVIEELVERGEL